MADDDSIIDQFEDDPHFEVEPPAPVRRNVDHRRVAVRRAIEDIEEKRAIERYIDLMDV